ncbi:VC0807 family protein [Amycolatopsis mediterranei]|uniref:VC0807 family protein n=1 Tax=Amycolatopsis mediterranei TaxID=33910 RepID=UPI003438017E
MQRAVGASAARTLIGTLALDVGMPVAAYFVAGLAGASTYQALLIGTVVAGLRVLWVVARQRRIEPFALFLLLMFGVSLVLAFVGGDARLLLAKDAATSLLAGLVMVGSCLVGKPFACYAAERMARSSGRTEQFRAAADAPGGQAHWHRVSLVWGIALLVDALVRVAAIYLLPVDLAAGLSQVLMVAVYVGLVPWTLLATSSRRKSVATAVGA